MDLFWSSVASGWQVIDLGDVSTAGGGQGTHIFGSLMIDSNSAVGGNADIWWSSEAINKCLTDFNPKMKLVGYQKMIRTLDVSELSEMKFYTPSELAKIGY